MDAERLLARPQGEMVFEVNLIRGSNPYPTSDPKKKKQLRGDAVTAKEFIDSVAKQVGVRWADADAEDQLGLLARTYGELLSTMKKVGQLEHLSMSINDHTVGINPADVSFIVIKGTGLFAKLKEMSGE